MKRAHILAPIVVLLLAVAVFNLPGQAVTRFKLALSSLLVPFFSLNNAAQRALPRGVDALTPRAELIRQNARLREENNRELANISDTDLPVQVQTIFRDAAGMLVGDETGWQMLVLPGNGSARYEVGSLKPHPGAYTVQIKTP